MKDKFFITGLMITNWILIGLQVKVLASMTIRLIKR